MGNAGEEVLESLNRECLFLAFLVEPTEGDAQAKIGMVDCGNHLVDSAYGGVVGALGQADHAGLQESLSLSPEPLNSLERDGAELALEGVNPLGVDLVF